MFCCVDIVLEKKDMVFVQVDVFRQAYIVFGHVDVVLERLNVTVKHVDMLFDRVDVVLEHGI